MAVCSLVISDEYISAPPRTNFRNAGSCSNSLARAISIVHDVLAVEDSSRLVPVEFHRGPLVNFGVHHVSDGSAA